MEQNQKLDNTLVEEGKYSYLKPPKEAHLFFPKGDQVQFGKEKKIVRWYFDGDAPYTEFEMGRLKKLQDLFKEKKEEEIFNKWTNQEIQRQLQGNQFDSKKCRKDMKEHMEWIPTISRSQDKDIQAFIDSGFMTIQGRDHRYRPILVMHIYKMDPKKITKEILLKGIDYINKIVIDHMMLPGQIENWVIIMDLNNAKVSDIPLSMIKTIVSYTGAHYKSRLYRLYMVNTTSGIMSVWKAIKIFLESFTVEKINIIKEGSSDVMFKHINKSQLSQKFGGILPETEQNWPPQVNDKGPFLIEGEEYKDAFISQEEYKKKIESGEIKYGVKCQELLN